MTSSRSCARTASLPVMPRIVAASMAAQTLATNRLAVPSIFHLPIQAGSRTLTARVLYHPGPECHSIFNLVRWEYRTSFAVDSSRLPGHGRAGYFKNLPEAVKVRAMRIEDRFVVAAPRERVWVAIK